MTAPARSPGAVSVFDCRCMAGPADRPFVECHDGFALSYVRAGSFGCHARGARFDLVVDAGSNAGSERVHGRVDRASPRRGPAPAGRVERARSPREPEARPGSGGSR